MSRPFFLLLILCSTFPLSAQNGIEHRTYFHVASEQLNAGELDKLIALCDLVEKEKLASIEITGHADVRGDADYNHELSARRCKTIRDLMMQHCGFDVPISLISAGVSLAKASIGDEQGLQADRRVDIVFKFRDQGYSLDHHRHQQIRPLLPLADVPREHYVADASLPIEFIANDGVRVRIAPDAIIHADGTPVSGDVDITYRSFNDPWSIIASGIPMHVGQGADAGHMESMGMFEIYASKEGERLFLQEGGSISLTKTTESERTPDFLDWSLDESTGAWVEQAPTTEAASPSPANTGFTKACERYLNSISSLPIVPDTTSMLTRMEREDYCGTVPCERAEKPYLRVKGVETSPYKDNRIPTIRIGLAKKAYYGRQLIGFTVSARGSAVKEWRTFSRRLWAYAGPLDKREFRKLLARKHFYQDVRLMVDDCGTTGKIMLKDRGQWVELPVDLSVHQNSKEELNTWSAELERYQRAFALKVDRFDTRLNAKVTSTVGSREKLFLTYWKMVRKAMNNDELAMTQEEFHTYAVAARDAQILATAGMGNAMINSFAMQGFGVYNVDRIMKLDPLDPMLVDVRDEHGTPFKWEKALAVLGGKNAVVTYWPNYLTTPNTLTLSKGTTQLLFVNEEGGVLLVTDPLSFQAGRVLVLSGRSIDPASDGMEALAMERP